MVGVTVLSLHPRDLTAYGLELIHRDVIYVTPESGLGGVSVDRDLDFDFCAHARNAVVGSDGG